MALQTAPDTITLATTGGNTIFSLYEVTDSTITYYGLSFNGVAYTMNERPLLRLKRTVPSSSQAQTKFNIYFKHTVFDALGVRLSDIVLNTDILIPNSYMLHTNAIVTRMVESASLFLNTAFLKAMPVDGSFAR